MLLCWTLNYAPESHLACVTQHLKSAHRGKVDNGMGPTCFERTSKWSKKNLFFLSIKFLSKNVKMIREQLCYFISIKSLSKNKVAFLYIISEFAVLQTQTWLIILAGQTLLTCPHPLPSMTLRHAAGKVVPLVPHSMGPIPLCPLNCYLPTPGLRNQSTSPYSSA